MIDQQTAFLDKICKLWEEGENEQPIIDALYKYYTGENYANPADSFFLKENRTPLNIIGQIVDAKHAATLDAQFDAAVVPEISTFTDMQSLRDMQDVASVLNSALKKVLKDNNIDDFKERALRWGFIKRGVSQTCWEVNDKNPQGDIKINVIDPRNVRYTKGAKSISDLTMIAYSVDMDAAIAKKNYARNPDGSFDVELCKKIDQAAGISTETKKGPEKAVASYSIDSGAGLAYVRDSQSAGTGKYINLVVMFLFDGTLEAPQFPETPEDTQIAQEMRLAYPNGRMIVFSPAKDRRLVLQDQPAPESFKSLGNIDMLLLNKLDGLDVKSEVEALSPIQERINGTIRKLRSAVGGNINSVLFDENMRGVVEDNAFVNLPVVFVEGLGSFDPPVLNNGGIEQAMKLRELIESYKQDAYETARITRAWISGENQDNVKSGEHADALNESSMTAIRSIQRSFKDYYISVCEKCVSLILENYTEQRLIDIGTGVSQKQYAMFDTQQSEQGEERSIKFIDQAGRIARSIKVDPSWKFRIEVTSGTDIPRSRREHARLIDEVIASPIMQSGDIDMIDMYLAAKDFPNRHAVVEMLRKKFEEKAQRKMSVSDLVANPPVGDSAAKIFKALEGYSKAQGKMLEEMGLPGDTDTLTTAPAQSITSKSDAGKIAVIAPQQISESPEQAQFGHDQATDMEVIAHMKHSAPKPPKQSPEEGK